MRLARTVALFALLVPLAHAEDPAPAAAAGARPLTAEADKVAVEVKNPLGATLKAYKVSNPKQGTPEYAILDSIKMILAGNFDGWMDKWCADRCDTSDQRAGMKQYNLDAAKQSASDCLQGDNDDEIIVTLVKGDLSKDTTSKVYTFCGAQRMPAPAELKWTDGGWKIVGFSW